MFTLQKKTTNYIFVPDVAVAQFESYIDYWVEERSEGLGKVPIFYPELIYDDTFCQRHLYDLLGEIATYRIFGLPGGEFPISLDPDFLANKTVEEEINFEVTKSDELYQVDMMMYLNNHHICYGVGKKPGVNEDPVCRVLFNQPVREVW